MANMWSIISKNREVSERTLGIPNYTKLQKKHTWWVRLNKKNISPTLNPLGNDMLLGGLEHFLFSHILGMSSS
jgi:hypothetical protein